MLHSTIANTRANTRCNLRVSGLDVAYFCVAIQRGRTSDRRGMRCLSRDRGHPARSGPKVRDGSSRQDARDPGKSQNWLNCRDDGLSRRQGDAMSQSGGGTAGQALLPIRSRSIPSPAPGAPGTSRTSGILSFRATRAGRMPAIDTGAIIDGDGLTGAGCGGRWRRVDADDIKADIRRDGEYLHPGRRRCRHVSR